MSKLADILDAQMGGSSVGGLRAQLGELRQRFGTVTAASKAIGIDRRTWQRIESGKSRGSSSTLGRIKSGVLRGRTEGFSPRLKFNYNGRDRTVGAANLKLREGTVESMQNAHARGDKEGAARAFIDGIGDSWYHDQFERVYDGDPDPHDYGGSFGAA